ncbi:MAG: DNA sulfur modification protein DndD [Chloroflexota bacterium]
MIITRLTIDNFGVYSGLYEFDLRPRKIEDELRPIVLVGGKNGSGKTTVLEAIRLCLYGKLALGTRVRETDYKTYIKQRFHRNFYNQLPVQSMQIGIVFEHVHAGEKSVYDAVRSWRLEGQTLHENVSIYKDAHPFHEIAPEHWDDFLRDIIPPGVADLFFFDGEQIQMLADTETEAVALETAIGGLLNIDLVERLQSDLNNYVRQQDGRTRSALREEFSQLSAEIDELELNKQDIIQKLGGIRNKIGLVAKDRISVEQVLLTEGAQFLEQRAELETRLKQVFAEIEQTRKAIRDLASGLLPFVFAPDWSHHLKERLLEEEEVQRDNILVDYQQKKADELQQRFSDNALRKRIGANLSDDEWQSLIAEVDAHIRPETPEYEIQIVHQVSESQRRKLLSQIDEALTETPYTMDELTKRLDALEIERGDIQKKLKQVPEKSVVEPKIREFQRLSEEAGYLEQEKQHNEEELRRLQYRIDDLERKRSRIWHKIADIGDADEKVDMAANIQVVLEQYLERLTAMKVDELEQLVGRFFNLLSRKKQIVKEVKIDVKNYTVTLYGANRMEIPKSKLSAGERQLYAMSLLWALRSLSGRSLPIIIDTPMGRLDSDHRERLLTHFFPHAAHQVILLSTDTEVNDGAFEALEPAISHVYRLEFDQDTGHTEIEHTYFNQDSEAQPL